MDDDSLQRQILTKLVRLTESGKLEWTETKDIAGIRAHARISPTLVASFYLRASSAEIAAWQKLAVQDRGESIVNVTNPANVIEQAFVNPEQAPLHMLANRLFEAAVLEPKRDRMRRVLKELDSLQ